MAETPPVETPKGNGMTTLLTTLAGSGDNWVKLMIVGGIIVNGILTTKSGTATRHDVNKVQQIAARQIRAIYANQQVWATYAEATVEEHRVIMEKLGIPKDQWPRMPPMRFEEPNDEEDEGDSK